MCTFFCLLHFSRHCTLTPPRLPAPAVFVYKTTKNTDSQRTRSPNNQQKPNCSLYSRPCQRCGTPPFFRSEFGHQNRYPTRAAALSGGSGSGVDPWRRLCNESRGPIRLQMTLIGEVGGRLLEKGQRQSAGSRLATAQKSATSDSPRLP